AHRFHAGRLALAPFLPASPARVVPMTEPYVRPDVRAFLDVLKANPRPILTGENIAAMRPMAPAGMAMLKPPVGELALTRDAAAAGPAGEIPVRMFDARAE